MGIQLGLGRLLRSRRDANGNSSVLCMQGTVFPFRRYLSFICLRTLRSTLSTSTKARTCGHELAIGL